MNTKVPFGNSHQFLGVALSMGILSKWMQLRDPIVGFISGMSQMGGCLIYVLATNAAMMYLGK